MNNIVIIDDHVGLSKMMKQLLEKNDFLVFCFTFGEFLIGAKLPLGKIVYIVDASLPNHQGEDLIRSIRHRDQLSPIFMISDLDHKEKINRCLMSGADDYLIRPFDQEIFISKILNAQKKNMLILDRTKDVEFKRFSSTNSIERNGISVKLTSTEFRMLSLLMDSSNKKCSRHDLFVTSNHAEITERTIDVHIHSLRPKLLKIGIRIQSIRGYGYEIIYE